MSVSRSLAWMGSAQGLSMGLQFAVQVVLARYLTLHDAGIYAVGLAMVGALGLIQNLGLQALIVREEELTPEISTTTFTINAILSVLVAAVVYAMSFAGAKVLGDTGVGRVLAALAVVPLINAFSFLPLAILEREGRFKQIALSGTVGSVVGAAVTIATCWTGASYMSAAYGQWANAVCVLVTMAVIARQHFGRRFSFHSWRRVSEFGLQLLAVNGVNAIGLRLSDILLPRFLGLAALGLYSRASGLNGLIWGNVHMLVGRVMLVDFVAIHRQGGALRDRYIATVDVVTVLLWPVFAGFAVISGPFIHYVFGARWVDATYPLMLLCAASMLLVSITMTWELFTATNELRTQTRIEFIRAIVALVLFIGGCLISLEAAAFARVLEAIVAIALYRPHIGRMTKTRAADFWPIYGRNLLLTAIAIAPTAAVMTLHRWQPDVSIVMLGSGMVAGALLWGAMLTWFRHPLIGEIRALVGRKRGAVAA